MPLAHDQDAAAVHPPPLAFVPAPDGVDLVPAPSAGVRRNRALIEFDELYPFVVDGSVSDVLAVGGGSVWIDRGGGLVRTAIALREDRLRELAIRLVGLGGRHVDESTPAADVDLGEGIRVHVVLSPISVAGTALSIRLPRIEILGLAELHRGGLFDAADERSAPDRAFLEARVHDRTSFLISGGTGTGKTTLLAALLSTVPPHERIIVIEDVAELRVEHPHMVRLQARQANSEGAGGLGVDRLVREALRMRPDRIVVGECRGAEIRDLMTALNTGHRGGAGTVHANSLADVPTRLEALGLLAGLAPPVLARQAASAFDLVLHLERDRTGRRRLAAAGRLRVDGEGRLDIQAMVR
ncbi:CpaF family protein [Curtobacterium ammoniigenes]|uniref:CpaF family protein n=1 Tax=Curtobacterium ammoniigenes TaxID=395387 RepID=UPI0009FB0888|nr:ATPase, T2SS/T4P/T4SS family [Curtobacterium ammoniigenes]